MSRVRVIILAVVVALPAAPARAALIGLGGGNSDPQSITNITFLTLTEADCAFSNTPLPAGYRCALFDGSGVSALGISAIDLRLDDGDGHPIPFPDSIVVDPLSALQTLTGSPLFDDGFTFRLSGPPLQSFTYVFYSSHGNGLNDPLSVSSVGVNGVSNPGAQAVPEPATLLLIGPAAWWIVRRRASC